MKRRLFQQLFSLTLVWSIPAWGQVDPSSALLLKGNAESSQLNLDSGRYTIRQAPAPVPNATNVQKPAEKTPVPKTADKSNPTKVVAPKTDSANVGAAAEGNDTAKNDEAFPERMKDFFLGGDVEDILRYRGGLHPQDPRQNFIEVSIAPGVLYADAKSGYWYRKFHSSGPGIGASGRFWLSPFFGLHGAYFTTLGADMTAEYDSDRKVKTDHHFTNAGMWFRKFFTMTRKSPSVAFGIDYDEYQVLVPKSEDSRIRLKTSGVSLRLETAVPKTVSRAWVFGVDFMPKVKVAERKTALDLSSGERPTAYSTKFTLGQDFTFNRNQKVFWRLSHRLDKVIYEGTATEVDPISGAAPTGVSVTQGTSLFQLGFTWAD